MNQGSYLHQLLCRGGDFHFLPGHPKAAFQAGVLDLLLQQGHQVPQSEQRSKDQQGGVLALDGNQQPCKAAQLCIWLCGASGRWLQRPAEPFLSCGEARDGTDVAGKADVCIASRARSGACQGGPAPWLSKQGLHSESAASERRASFRTNVRVRLHLPVLTSVTRVRAGEAVGSHTGQRTAGTPCTQSHHAGWEVWPHEGWAGRRWGGTRACPLPCWPAGLGRPRLCRGAAFPAPHPDPRGLAAAPT